MSARMTATDYERLTEYVTRLISRRSPWSTTRLVHDVTLSGRSGPNQIDVLWEFVSPSGTPQRIVFECRKYRNPLKRKDVFAWRGVVEDIDTPELPTMGVMVTSTDYQSGARQVAETYGVVILQLREPTDHDIQGRMMEIGLLVSVRMPTVLTNIEVAACEELNPTPTGQIPVDAYDLVHADGRRERLDVLLWAGELAGLDQPPTPLHRVKKTFDPPATLLFEETPLLRVVSVTATVGEVEVDPVSLTIGGRDQIAWMVANVLDGTRVWFTHDERHYTSDDHQIREPQANEVLLGALRQLR